MMITEPRPSGGVPRGCGDRRRCGWKPSNGFATPAVASPSAFQVEPVSVSRSPSRVAVKVSGWPSASGTKTPDRSDVATVGHLVGFQR
jgi:hypothetical protein